MELNKNSRKKESSIFSRRLKQLFKSISQVFSPSMGKEYRNGGSLHSYELVHLPL